MPTTTCPGSCLSCWLLSRPRCDGTGRDGRSWLASRGADPDSALRYFPSLGGFCSCEVLGNALDGSRLVLDDLLVACGASR